MSKSRRNKIIAIGVVCIVVTIAVLGAVTPSLLPSSMPASWLVGEEYWELQVKTKGGSVGGKEYSIPATIDTASLPVYVRGTPSGTELTIDPDYVGGTYQGKHNLGDYQGKPSSVTNDGALPDVVMTLTQVWPVNPDGSPTVDKKPAVAKQWDDVSDPTNKLHWTQTYFKFQAELKTATTLCTEEHQYNPPGHWLWDGWEFLYEHDSVVAEFWVGIHLHSVYQNSSFQSAFGDAKVTYVKMTYNPSTVTENSFVFDDDKADVYNTYDVNAALQPLYDATNGSDRDAMLPLSATLDPGILYNYYGSANQGMKMQVNVRIVYEVMFSVVTSRALNMAERPSQEFSLVDFLVGILTNPTDIGFWVLVGIVLVVVVLLWRRRHRKAEAA